MVDESYTNHHFSPIDPVLVGEGPLLGDGLDTGIDLMLSQCPVAHTDAKWYGVPDGGWIVNRHQDVMDVLRDPDTFPSRRPHIPDDMLLIPFDIDPPYVLDYRRLLQPYLTIKEVSKFELTARAISRRLIDDILASGGRCEVVYDLAFAFATEVQWRWLLGIEVDDPQRVLEWIFTYTYRPFAPDFAESTRNYIQWVEAAVARRRAEPPRGDLVNGLFEAEIDGRPLTGDEITRILMTMILAGVSATADSIGNIMLRLAVYPELQEQLRSNPELLPNALEEFLRIEPPATGAPRQCARDTKIGGQTIHKGDSLFVHIAAANRDPAEFEHPKEIDFDRKRSRSLAFGAGYHRCLGSNFARQNLRVFFAEILGRTGSFDLVEKDTVERTAGVSWRMSHMPMIFLPGAAAD